MSLVLQILGVLLGTGATAVLFHVPRNALFWAALAGLFGWAVQTLVSAAGWSPAGSALLGAVTVSLVAEALARTRRMPATVFVVPGILPLVPGTRAYQAMLAMLRDDHTAAATEGASALIAAGGIAVGILLGTALTRGWTGGPPSSGQVRRRRSRKPRRIPSPRPDLPTARAVLLPLPQRR